MIKYFCGICGNEILKVTERHVLTHKIMGIEMDEQKTIICKYCFPALAGGILETAFTVDGE